MDNMKQFELLFEKYMPEIHAIEKGKLAPINIDDFKQQLIDKIN